MLTAPIVLRVPVSLFKIVQCLQMPFLNMHMSDRFCLVYFVFNK
jgi:hypothetical protein